MTLPSTIRNAFAVPTPYRYDIASRKLFGRYPMIKEKVSRSRWRRLAKFRERYSVNPSQGRLAYLLSVPHYTTGIGHSVMEVNTGLIRSRRLGLKYLHLPIRDPWESFFGIGRAEDPYFDVIRQGAVIVDLPHLPFPEDPSEEARLNSFLSGFRSEKTVIFKLFPQTTVFEQSEGAAVLKEKYMIARRNRSVVNFKVPNRINVSIHVRRGDIIRMREEGRGPWRERYVELEYFVELARMTQDLLGEDNVHFNLFSQGAEEDFACFRVLKSLSMWLDYDVQATFDGLVDADVLICSPSSFSYLPALFSSAITIFKAPFWHDLPKGWIIIEETVASHRQELASRLAEAGFNVR